MMKKTSKIHIVLGVIVLILSTLACGSFQVGVVTPTSESVTPSVSKDQGSEPEPVAVDDVKDQIEEDLVIELKVEDDGSSKTIMVTAWLGHIASLPQGSQYDDMVVLSPQGTGELGLVGATPEIEAEIRVLRDAEGPHEWVHLWGKISCEVDDYNNCQLWVEQLQYGAHFSEEAVVDWVGTIRRYTFNGGDATIFELPGDYPMWYSIHASQDQNLQAEIKYLRDTGTVVKVNGKLMVGIPYVNGTRIEVSDLVVIEPGTQPQPEYEIDLDVTADWPVFINDRYGYQIQYPMDATVSLTGPLRYQSEDLPEGMTSDQYLDSLQKEYTDRLCVSIKYALGWVNISAPPNQEKFLNPCGPTGVGSGELIPMIQSVYVGDQLYQANGHEVRLQVADGDGNPITGETLDLHYETYMIKLEDGTMIRFGSTTRHDATYDDYLMKTREILLQILGTYQPVP